MALQHALLFLAQAVGAQAALFVVLVFTEQGALLAVLFAPAWRVLVSGQRLAVEVDGGEGTAPLVAVVQLAAIGQSAMAELAQGVVFIAQGGPALVFFDQAILQVVTVGQRPLAVLDTDQAAQGVVGVVHLLAIGQGFHQQAPGGVALIGGDPLAAVVGEFLLLDQVTVEVVGVGGAAPVEGGFALDQAVGVVAEVVVLTPFVLDLGEQQAGVVVAVTAWSPRILLGGK